MEHQHPHGFLRPPPPPPPHVPPTAADPYQRTQPLPPPPPSQSWPYSNQFQYQTQHSPSPPPPQWVTQQPHSSDLVQYPPPPPPPPYPAHQPPPYLMHPHYPPPQPLPPRPTHVPQSYAQDWGNGSWSHHQSWDYPSNNNNQEDWAEKARVWAAAKAATDNQYPPPAGRPEEQNHFHEQYSQSINPQSLSVHAPVDPASSYQQYQVGIRPPNRMGLGQLQESQYVSPGQSSFASDRHVPYAARDGSLIGDSYEQFPQQEKSSINPLVHQQEVPSSYSSVSGNEDAGDRYGKFNSSSSLSVPSMPHHHVQPVPPVVGRSGWTEEPHHLLSSQPAESLTDLSDQPLNFAPHFNRNLDQHMQPNFTHPSGGPVRGLDPTVANYAWTPSSAPGVVYPSAPPTLSSGPQVDHPIAVPSPASGHSAPIFPTGPGFQSTVPLIGASFGVGTGVVSHTTASFSGDAYGVSSVERPKKASVPNWLREEIIKNKAVITTSAPNISQEDSQSIEEDSNDKSSKKGDQADSKSTDSSRSTEDEDDDEDEVEAARTAAINQEIKRVLTEVLLKVTDELFDEIATKVLNEDDLPVEVGHDNDLSNQRVLSSTPAISTTPASAKATASAKVLIPIKAVKNDFEDGSEKSTSGSAGDVLGLSSYASDVEDDDIQVSGKLNSKKSSSHQQSSSNTLSEGAPSVDNGGSVEGTEEPGNILANLENTGRKSPIITVVNRNAADKELNDNRASETRQSSKKASRVSEDDMQHGSDISKSNKSVTEKAVERNERPDGNLDARKSSDDSRSRKSGNRSDKNDRHENRRNSVGKDHKESESAKERVDKKGDEDHRRHEEKHVRTEREYHDGSKDKGKEKSRTGEKAKDTESRKRTSPPDGKEGKSETRRDRRTNAKENDEKRQDKPKDEKRERSRYKNGSSSSRHKPRRSSSVGSRDGETKDNSVVNRPNDSSDESSDDSRRKSRHTKRHKSPSPMRSRKRQVSRSPHSKHSKRRHTPYSSLETARGRRSPSRSRSRSPVTRRR